MGTDVGPLRGFHHVKLPVADVIRSRDWYQRVLGFEVALEFVEDGVLMGLALRDPAATVSLALRADSTRAAALAGFDPIALGVPDGASLWSWKQRLDDLGEPHGGIVTGHSGSVLVGLLDPDGIEIRLYADENPPAGSPQ
jgi:catechol 2,3-dioxygenase-like lactoylglutathione lyase family enzyme